MRGNCMGDFSPRRDKFQINREAYFVDPELVMVLERIVLMKNMKLCLLVCPGSIIVTLSTLKTPGFSTQMNDIHGCGGLHHSEWLLLLSLDCCW